MTRFRDALTVLFVERTLPWRVENWLNQRTSVQWYRTRQGERWDRALFGQFVSRNDIVFDVGANVGDKTRVFLDLGARVVCIEPDPRNVACLRNRYSSVPHRVEIVSAGVGATIDRCEFHLSQDTTTRSTFSVDRMASLGDDCRFDEKTQVDILTLDSLIARFGAPRFCKIDVEGYEPEVLRGLTQPLRALCFEFHGELIADAERCLDHLDGLGMTRFNVLLHPVGRDRIQRRLSHLFLPQPVTKDVLLARLDALRPRKLSGDIYAFA